MPMKIPMKPDKSQSHSCSGGGGANNLSIGVPGLTMGTVLSLLDSQGNLFTRSITKQVNPVAVAQGDFGMVHYSG